jgi:hypothetical protein
MVSGAPLTFAVACFGGVLVELLRWYSLRESQNLPKYVKSPTYWGITVLMILAGGGLALLYGTDPKSPLLVANIGLSAPLIIKAFADTTPKPSPSATQQGPPTPGFGFDDQKPTPSPRSLTADFLSWR